MSTELEPAGLRRIYRVMCHVAGCDGDVAASEREVLSAAAARFGLEAGEAEALEREGLAGEALEIGASEPERAALITAMVDVAVADRRLDGAERKLLVKIAKELGLSLEALQAELLPRL